MIYHLQVIKKGVSVLLDSDINYFHHFDIDDIISIEYTINSGIYPPLSIVKLNSNSMIVKNPEFVINWDSIKSRKLSISELILENYLSDISQMVVREKKLNLLGIYNNIIKL
jgi:hypothetical protein